MDGAFGSLWVDSQDDRILQHDRRLTLGIEGRQDGIEAAEVRSDKQCQPAAFEPAAPIAALEARLGHRGFRLERYDAAGPAAALQGIQQIAEPESDGKQDA